MPTPTPAAIIGECSWSYPDPTATLSAGALLSFAASVPSTYALTLATVPVSFSMVWALTDTATSQPLVEGTDYHVVAGGLQELALSIVIDRARSASFNVTPLLSVAAGGTPVNAGFAGVTYTPAAAPQLPTPSAVLALCSWSYPDPGVPIPAGTILPFAAAVPSSYVPAATGVTIPVSFTITWSLADGGSPTKPLVQGVDYQIVSGGINQLVMSIVVNPTRSAPFTVTPRISVSAGGTPIQGDFPPVTLAPVPAPAIEDTVAAALTDALALTTSANLLAPGQAALLQVAPKQIGAVPQLVTNIVQQTPGVQVRASIPVGDVINALLAPLGPLAGALSRVLPSIGSSALPDVTGDVSRLLDRPVAIPIALDIRGDQITKTLTPLGPQLLPTFDSNANDPMNLSGLVPVLNFPAAVNLVSASWSVTSSDSSFTYAKLTPNLDLLQTLLLRPKIVSPNALLTPTPVTVTVELDFNVPALSSTPITVTLPPVTLYQLPLVLPHIAAVFRHAFDDFDRASEQAVVLTTDSIGATVMPSLGSLVELLSTLSALLGGLTNAVQLVAGDVTAWSDFIGLGQAVVLLATQLGQIASTRIAFLPIYAAGTTRKLRGEWDDAISAMIHIGVPATQSGDTFFRVSDSNGSGYIDQNGLGAATAYSSIIPDLNDPFASLLQVPAGAATTNQPKTNFNDTLEVLGFPSV